jgi:hypothetical protein
MSDALFYELVSNPVDRKACFAKFPKRENPVELVMHVGGYLRKEIDMRRPSGKPSMNVEQIRFEFNENLLSDEYELPPEAAEVTAEHHAELQADIASLVSRALSMRSTFPGVFSGSDEQRRLARLKAERTITTDQKALLQFYSKLKAPIRKRGFPRSRHLTEEWALFRWLQVQMLFALDLSWRYGNNLKLPFTAKQHERFEHDVLDSQYMLLGVLEGSFATHESKLKAWYASLCPKGALYTQDG